MENGLGLQILKQLKPGKHNAIPGRVLASKFGLKDDRAIRLEIDNLIFDGHPIASSVHPPYGYYIVKTAEETNEYLANLRSRGKEVFLRRKHFRDASRNIYEPGEQLRFWSG